MIQKGIIMAKSLIQVVNTGVQTVDQNGIITLGSVVRRFGCNCRLSGNAIEAIGEGYYTIDAVVTVQPTALGDVTVALYSDGEQIPGAIASAAAAAAEDPVTLPIIGTIRNGCCGGSTNITAVLLAGPGTVTNVSVRAVKE
jgi:hypothetical protein